MTAALQQLKEVVELALIVTLISRFWELCTVSSLDSIWFRMELREEGGVPVEMEGGKEMVEVGGWRERGMARSWRREGGMAMGRREGEMMRGQRERVVGVVEPPY